MDQVMTKGVKIYTAALVLTAATAFALAAPEQSALAGMAVLAGIVGIVATAMGRDLQRHHDREHQHLAEGHERVAQVAARPLRRTAHPFNAGSPPPAFFLARKKRLSAALCNPGATATICP